MSTVVRPLKLRSDYTVVFTARPHHLQHFPPDFKADLQSLEGAGHKLASLMRKSVSWKWILINFYSNCMTLTHTSLVEFNNDKLFKITKKLDLK